MVDARVSLNEYTNRVLEVIKAKYGLKDKSEALNKFVGIHGEEEVEHKVKESYIKKILDIENQHFKKYGYRKMNKKELNELFEE